LAEATWSANLTPELLLFDLGGVLVEFSGARDLPRLMRVPEPPADIMRRWISCPHTTAFESGRLSGSIWAERFVRDWDLTITPEEFVATFATWSSAFLPGAVELLARLRTRYRLAALSNSNEMHWNRNRENGILKEFEFALASHELGCCKPDPGIFSIALERAGVASPEAIVFFDDLASNVEGAKSVGLRAYQVQGIGEVRARLRDEGLFPFSL
jgi:putative hydrolase of the HAD superfamily